MLIATQPRPALEAVQNEKCTSLYGTPTMYVDMVAMQVNNIIPRIFATQKIKKMTSLQEAEKFDLSSLHTGIMAGSPCPKDLCEKAINDLNMKDFVVRTSYIMYSKKLSLFKFVFRIMFFVYFSSRYATA